MNFVPSFPILSSLAAALVLPLLLAALSHGPWRVAAPGRRFLLAAAAAATGWIVSLAILGEVAGADLAAGLLILLAAVLAEFTVWTLIAWGFTTSMLMVLAREGRDASLDEWISAYTGGRTIETFTQDRLGVLFRFALAARENGRVVITPGPGMWTARLAWLLRTIFGLNP